MQCLQHPQKGLAELHATQQCLHCHPLLVLGSRRKCLSLLQQRAYDRSQGGGTRRAWLPVITLRSGLNVEVERKGNEVLFLVNAAGLRQFLHRHRGVEHCLQVRPQDRQSTRALRLVQVETCKYRLRQRVTRMPSCLAREHMVYKLPKLQVGQFCGR
eukprot:scaffold820_cov376-Prasinococcus_capsulatus_cf.AAC.16